MLEVVSSTKIGIVTFSDHAPVTLQLKIGEVRNKSNSWRLNEELLHDKAVEQRIKDELEQFFRINSTEDVSEATVWETHKAYIMGILIREGAEEKKKE